MIRYHDFNTGNKLLDDSLELYLMHGYEPGGFLTSVLANDLFMSVGRADHWNQDNLPRIVHEIRHKMTPVAYGSYTAVKDWCADKDGCRSYYSDIKQQEYVMRVLKDEVRPKRDLDDVPF